MPLESAAQDTSGPPAGVERVLALLNEALEAVDTLGLPPEIGARLQELISAVEESARD